MADDKPVTVVWVSGVTGINALLEVVLGDLDLLGSQLVVVIGIEVEVRHDVTEIGHDFLAASSARRVRWAHVGRVFADDVANSHLVLDHLVVSLLLGDFAEILVGPCVRGDLMAIVVHILDDACPVFVNGALADVVASDEEGGVGSSCLELFHNTLGIDVGTIVVGDCNGSRIVADVDAPTAVGNASKLRAGVVPGACSSRSLIGVCRTISNMFTVQSIDYIIPHAGPKLNKQSGAWQCS